MFMGTEVIKTGMIFLPAGSGKTSFASREDLAQAGATLLTSAGHEGKVYELGGTESVSFDDIATTLSELSGKEIRYISPSPEEFIAQLKSFGLADELIQGATTFCVAISQGEFDFQSTDLEHILGRTPQSVKEFLKGAYHL
jgi:NAD(P)H dehydrogenase (quinone)